MKKTILCVLFIALIVLFPLSNAKEISFSTEQKEYYFLTGQDAVIPLTINTTFNKDINGRFQYTIMQIVNQGGISQSSTQSNTQSFTVQQENQTIGLNFGSSNTPVVLSVSMEFSFSDENKDYVISLDDIIIHFVSNQSQMNNQQNQQQSTSEEIINAPQQNNQQQNQQQNQPQTTQEKLQNNQMNQDSQALKEQMEQQMQQQQEQQEAFKQQVMNNSQIQKMQQQLQDLGYNKTSEEFDPETNNTGSFNFTYQNKKGETANIEGNMENGELTNLQKQTAEDRKEMLETLNQSKTFQEFKQQLRKEGFNQTDISFHQNGNNTRVDLTYTNEMNETATIQAEFEDKELEKVELHRQNEFPWYLVVIGLIILIIVIFCYLYIKYKRNKNDENAKPASNYQKPFDYHLEAQRLLEEAKKDFASGNFKDAYGKAGQSIRLFLSYHHGIKEEMTNDELIRFLKNKKIAHDHIKQCLDLCSLVEFAKYNANETDFSTIVDVTHKVIFQ